MKVSERKALFEKFGGRCAYCGEPLEAGWHADHFKPIKRKIKWVRQRRKNDVRGFYTAIPTGEMRRPENDTFENMMPACPPCNLDKRGLALESWRKELSDSCGILMRNYPTYHHAKRFGLVVETPKPIVFYFEKVRDQKALELAIENPAANDSSSSLNDWTAGDCVRPAPKRTRTKKLKAG